MAWRPDIYRASIIGFGARRSSITPPRPGGSRSQPPVSAGIRKYAERARNCDLAIQATRIQWDATRKLGQLLIAMAERGDRGQGWG